MTEEEFESLSRELLEETMNIASSYKIEQDLLAQHFTKGDYKAEFNGHAACVAYALRYGIKTAFDTWSLLKKGPIHHKVGNITILGGGCAFELPVMMHFLKDHNKELHVKVIDPISRWRIFQPMHVRMAQKMGIRLHLEFVPAMDVLEQVDSYKTDLLVSFNSLTELSFGERKALRIAYDNCKRHLFWHSSLTVMQEVFGSSYVPMRDDLQFHPEAQLTRTLANRFPKLAEMNVFANLGRKGFYLMHNLSQVKKEDALTWIHKY